MLQYVMATHFPIKRLSRVYHVGSFNPNDKSTQYAISFEGKGLSVSLHPEDWRRIARLGDAPTWRLEKKGLFLNYRKLSDAQMQQITHWGIHQKYIELQDRIRVHIYDEDHCAIKTYTYHSIEEAHNQWEKDEIVKLERIEMPVATNRLKQEIGMQCPDALSMNFLATVYAEKVLLVDGVWWEDIHDPMHLSAPRGVIHASSLHTWSVHRIEQGIKHELSHSINQ